MECRFQELQLSGFSEKDRSIVKANPFADVDTLKEEGITKKLAIYLTGLITPKPKKNNIVKKEVKPTTVVSNNGIVRVYNANTQLTKEMSAKSANLLVSKQPDIYKII